MQLPTATINANTKITLRRMLPVPGEVLVQPGRQVNALNVVARTEVASRYQVIDITKQLARPEIDMSAVMQVAAGDSVKANQIIATLPGGLPFLQRSVRAPANGRIATVGAGWVLLETEKTLTELQAFVNGVVRRVVGNRGVMIETQGTMIEAACGFGGEAHGRLKRLVDSAYALPDAEALDETVADSIILGGQTIDEEFLRKAEDHQVRGIIVGSIPASLLNLNPPVKVRVVATEGFGTIPMSAYTFGILSGLTNQELSIRGQLPAFMKKRSPQTQDGSIIICTNTSKNSAPPTTQSSEAVIGSRIRVTQGRLLGASGTIHSIPSEPQTTEAGLPALGANVKVNNQIHFVPWANLEQIA